jgi:hypothetical protein
VQEEMHRVKRVTTLKGFDFPAIMGANRAEEQKRRSKSELVALLKSEGERFAGWLESLSPEFLAETFTDGMGEHATLERLECLGAGDESIRRHFKYIVPSGPLSRDAMEMLLSTLRGRLVVVDSFNATLNLLGLDGEKGKDVEKFWQGFDNFCRAGWAVLVLDHITKSSEGRGPYSIGSERKHSAAFSHLGFAVLNKQFITREGTGRSALAVNKDRGAFWPRPMAYTFEVEISGGWGTVRLSEPPKPGDVNRPTTLMEKVSAFVSAETADGREPSKGMIEKNVEGNAAAKRRAIEILEEEGFLTSRGTKPVLFTSVRPYSARDEEAARREAESMSGA